MNIKVLALLGVLIAIPTQAKAVDPVLLYVGTFLGEYVAGKLIDEVWDSVTDKPDMRLLDARLKDLEYNSAMRGEMRDEIRKLRESVNERTTREEFRKMVQKTNAEIGSIKRRLDNIEERVEKLEVENDDLKNNTKNAENAEYFRLRGKKFRDATEFHRSIACFNIAVKLGTGKTLILSLDGRAHAYKLMNARDVALVDYSEAVAQYEKRTEADDKRDLLTWSELGVIIYNDRASAWTGKLEYKKAVTDYTDVIRINPNNTSAYIMRGCASVGGHHRARLIAWENHVDFEALVKYMKDSEKYSREYYYNPAGALKDFDEAIRREPKSSDAFRNRGIVHSFEGKFDDAVSDLSEAIHLDPADAGANFWLALTYEGTGKISEAASHYRQYAKLAPKQWEADKSKGAERVRQLMIKN
ncbi:hypothetical protein FRUB_10045 [Fimbriiglobus ruber]|uniref:Tetratricopeptide repeat protein n=2 Tax=Fimbriiglobus ruber TaxID=1908690 RepID=A0A225D2M8_9BACT|nr:hypothetical protein FRUB_10045 [Fimbriiglobus ruber]